MNLAMSSSGGHQHYQQQLWNCLQKQKTVIYRYTCTSGCSIQWQSITCTPYLLPGRWMFIDLWCWKHKQSNVEFNHVKYSYFRWQSIKLGFKCWDADICTGCLIVTSTMQVKMRNTMNNTMPIILQITIPNIKAYLFRSNNTMTIFMNPIQTLTWPSRTITIIVIDYCKSTSESSLANDVPYEAVWD